jgi:hypothetical protein
MESMIGTSSLAIFRLHVGALGEFKNSVAEFATTKDGVHEFVYQVLVLSFLK